MAEQILLTVDHSDNSEIKRFVRTIGRRDRIIGYYACIDQRDIAPFLEKYLALPTNHKSVEHPRMVNALINTYSFDSELKRTNALGLKRPNLEQFLKLEASKLLPDPKSIDELIDFLRSEECAKLAGVYSRLVSLAIAYKNVTGTTIEEAVDLAEAEIGKQLKYKSEFIALF